MNYIKYKDQELPFLINFSVLEKFQNKTGEELSREGLVKNLSHIYILLEYALEAGLKEEDKPYNAKEYDFKDIVNYDDNYIIIAHYVGEYYNKILEKLKAIADKKKSSTNISKATAKTSK